MTMRKLDVEHECSYVESKRVGTVIVTGADGGVGAEVVKLCMNDGYDVLFTYSRHPDKANLLLLMSRSIDCKLKAMEVDLQNVEVAFKVVAAAERLAPVVGLVNVDDSPSQGRAFLDTSEEDMRTVLSAKVMSSMLMCKAAISHWSMKGAVGAIVNLTSCPSLGRQSEGVPHWASMGAVEAFSIGLAKEFAPMGIRVNVVEQGVVRAADTARTNGNPASEIPMRRSGQAIEVAEAVMWMLSRKASYVTGTVLRVTGGA
jgi:NAD(P)-dependent dehydrogenase (short-subunit alcohol dehydrogenase family)